MFRYLSKYLDFYASSLCIIIVHQVTEIRKFLDRFENIDAVFANQLHMKTS